MLGPWELVADDGSVTPVVVPGTVAQAFSDRLDERTWVFRALVTAVPDDAELAIDGVATSYEVAVDGTIVLRCRSMFAKHRIPLPEGKPPRARWRTRIVDDGSLRLIRTTLIGRCPGIAPGPPVVGPWRPVTLRTRREPLGLRTRMDGTTGVLTSSTGSTLTCAGVTGVGELRIPDVERWWPHTHGDPVLHDVTVDGRTVARVGFRGDARLADAQALDARQHRRPLGPAVVPVELGGVDRLVGEVPRHRQRAEVDPSAGGGGGVGHRPAVVRERQ